ncbi:MAG: mercury resistance system periplasmic binding protein MerP [Rubrivivax sp.]|nr:mercury resistance system periplasmic binding protein MerP [Rubrivivax sp.]
MPADAPVSRRPAAPAWSAPRTVALSLPTMDCAVCPITLKKAMVKVDGVSRAEVNFDKRQALVDFDDAKTSVQALTRATQDAGYPSTVVESPK